MTTTQCRQGTVEDIARQEQQLLRKGYKAAPGKRRLEPGEYKRSDFQGPETSFQGVPRANIEWCPKDEKAPARAATDAQP